MFKAPNYTQVPNDFFDELLPSLKEGELKVLIIIMRQTFGWGNKAWDRISVSQLVKKTGLGRATVIRAVQSLHKKKIITKVTKGEKGEQESWYSLIVQNENPIDDSKNLDQYQKDTGTSIKSRPDPRLKLRPTKETLFSKENTKEREFPPNPPKQEEKKPPERKWTPKPLNPKNLDMITKFQMTYNHLILNNIVYIGQYHIEFLTLPEGRCYYDQEHEPFKNMLKNNLRKLKIAPEGLEC